MRTELEEYRVPGLDDLAERIVEQDWLTDVPVPIPGIELGSRQSGAGHGGKERDRRRSRPNITQAVQQLRFELLHPRAVIRHVHAQGAAEYVHLVESLVDLAEHRSVAGEGDRHRAIYRRKR